uniref:Uncharacterized protein n=1 Tax=Arundo donax TaxID=35708 RepID=A0A0A9EAJ4_ARUDO
MKMTIIWYAKNASCICEMCLSLAVRSTKICRWKGNSKYCHLYIYIWTSHMTLENKITEGGIIPSINKSQSEVATEIPDLLH